MKTVKLTFEDWGIVALTLASGAVFVGEEMDYDTAEEAAAKIAALERIGDVARKIMDQLKEQGVDIE